jgi:plasmid maintenance system antidote protein VapI
MNTIEKLRKQFKESDLSGYALAKNSGVSRATVHRFIRGDGDILTSAADRIAEAMGFEIDLKKEKKKCQVKKVQDKAARQKTGSKRAALRTKKKTSR